MASKRFGLSAASKGPAGTPITSAKGSGWLRGVAGLSDDKAVSEG